MPYPFSLPSTSKLSFSAFANSSSHPSLPLATTTHRIVVRNALKAHKKLPPQSRPADLSTLLSNLQEYLEYLLALKAGLNGQSTHNESIDVALKSEISVQWRSTLTQGAPGKPSTWVKGKGIEFEICFVLTAVAYIYNAQARAQLLALYGSVTPSTEQRIELITNATKLLLEVASIHAYLSSEYIETDAGSDVVEVLSQTQAGLSSLALAEATLLAVLKDDPYPAVVAQDRNKNDKEWMIKPPEIPKVRAHLFARLCLAAGDHAGKAEAMLRATGRVDESLMRYASDLRKTSRARACRFFGIDAELGGETGKAIAWLLAAKKQLGFSNADHGPKLKGIAKLKKDWTERREDKKMEKGGVWGSDAGRLEELRINEMLEQKWNKMNDTVRHPLPLLGYCSIFTDQYSINTCVRTLGRHSAIWPRHSFREAVHAAPVRCRHFGTDAGSSGKISHICVG